MDNIDIKSYISRFKERLDGFISYYLDKLIASHEENEALSRLYTLFKEAGTGGKCIRGSLVKLGYEIISGCPAGDEILPAAAAFEILQTGILGHDDIIDKSPLRRCRDSIWRAASGRDDDPAARHYGVSQAICLGDIGIILANRLVAESDFEPPLRYEAMTVFHDVQMNTIDGEMLDVYLSHQKAYGDETGILQMTRLKTAWYTVIGPMQLGAVLAGAGRIQKSYIEEFGESLGIAFQMKDDILGVRASENEIGKSNKSDISEGKVTLLAYYALKNASQSERERLLSVYGQADISESDRQTVTSIFESTGAFSAVTKRAKSCLAAARGKIPLLTQNETHAVLLNQLVDLMFFSSV
ncbi:geranylgeranyl pyrophosphate synthase [Synergistales bacterium]|nr:geranylgeranyl pyrophosphate synthase [Synergistales bacterium]